jgi:hypothetical protein
MENLIGKIVKLGLVGLYGNAFTLLSAFRQAARRQNWSKDEIDKVLDEAMATDYNHLLASRSRTQNLQMILTINKLPFRRHHSGDICHG